LLLNLSILRYYLTKLTLESHSVPATAAVAVLHHILVLTNFY